VGSDAETGGNTLVGFNHNRPTVWRVYSRKKIKRKGWNGNHFDIHSVRDP